MTPLQRAEELLTASFFLTKEDAWIYKSQPEIKVSNLAYIHDLKVCMEQLTQQIEELKAKPEDVRLVERLLGETK